MIIVQLMFHVLSTMGIKLCLLLQTRDVKTAPYQLLLEEEMVPNTGKHFSSNFWFVDNNVLAKRVLENSSISWKIRKLRFLPWLVYLRDSKVALSKKWANLPLKSNN